MGQRKRRVNDYETRSFACELRISNGSKAPRIEGYAAVFDVLSEDLGGFRELIKPGAFTKTIRESDVRALFNPDVNLILGRSKPGGNKPATLTLEEDSHGLSIGIDPPDTQTGRDLLESIRRGDVDQMSFGFEKMKDRWLKEARQQIRALLEVRLFDVSPVVFPAYQQTSVDVRTRKMIYLRNRLDRDRDTKVERLQERIAEMAIGTGSRYGSTTSRHRYSR